MKTHLQSSRYLQNLQMSKAANLKDVEIKVEELEGRYRRIFAQIQIPYSLEQVWQVITDYEAFAKFMPNLKQCRRLEHPTGGIRLEQVRILSFLGLKFSGRSVFDIAEEFPHKIHYQLVEGDLKAFSGDWRLAPRNLDEKAGVALMYDFSILPNLLLPMALVERVFSHDMPASLLAIRQRVEDLFGSGSI